MTAELPLPGEDEVTAPWWAATRQRRLVIQHCGGCGRWQHYPRALCIRCGAASPPFEAASGRGVVDTWTEVRRAIRPDVPAPYLVARVRLDEGPVLLTRLLDVPAGTVLAGPGGLIGRAVTVDWLPLPDGRNLPAFRLTERSP